MPAKKFGFAQTAESAFRLSLAFCKNLKKLRRFRSGTFGRLWMFILEKMCAVKGYGKHAFKGCLAFASHFF